MNSSFLDNPQAYIARDRRQSLVSGEQMPDRVSGSAIFADISGFTALTEALRRTLGPQRGAEALTEYLDRVFHALIAELDQYDGNVIYFSGDAITAWMDGDDGSRAIASALAMQKVIAEVGRLDVGSEGSVQLALKVAVAKGTARRGMVGDSDIQRIDVLGGGLLDSLAAAEGYANQNEVLVDLSTIDDIETIASLLETRADAQSERRYGVIDELVADVAPCPAPEPEALLPEAVQPWILPIVYERITAGRGEFLADLRPAFPVFIRFGGFDFDGDDAVFDRLDEFIGGAQRIFARFGGNVLQLTLGDKGAYLYGVFGSPVAHEDDGIRSVSAAAELLTLSERTDATDIQIGIAHGMLRSGTYGHEMRRTFVCLGDAVNLAARLMSSAPPGTAYVHQEVQELTGQRFCWGSVAPLQLKGKSQEVIAHRLEGLQTDGTNRQVRYELPIVGRESELAALTQALEVAQSGKSQLLGLSAEAGLGKSRLLAEFVRTARGEGVFVAFGECQSFGVNTSYLVWREIWRRLLGVDEQGSADQQIAQVENALRRINTGLLPRLPLFADVLGISIPDTELTAAFDAKLRKSSLEDLLTVVLQARAADEPLVLVLEDCHWIDGLSRELLQALVRSTADSGLLVVIAYRPAAESGGALGLEEVTHFREMVLSELSPEVSRSVAASKVDQLFDTATVSDALIELVVDRSEGNPFYLEELLNYIAGQGVDISNLRALQALQLPDSLQSLVLSRIDALTESPRRTLKVASVFGRLFEAALLPGAYPELGVLDEVLTRLDELAEEDLVVLDQAESLSYLFRHVVTQEVSYNSMPFNIRADLHRRIGELIERNEQDDLDPHLDLLAHHYWFSDNEDRKQHFLGLAEASARARYANATAIEYGERLLTLVEGEARYDVLRNLGSVLELAGLWDRAEAVNAEAKEIAQALDRDDWVVRAQTALAEIARRQGRFDEASTLLDSAADRCRVSDDDEGLGLVLHVAGTLAAQQGDYQAAESAYRDSLSIRERLDDLPALGSLYSNLAIIAEYRSDYAGAHRACERALEIRSRIGDVWGISVSLSNMGQIHILEKEFARAKERLEEALRLTREVGDAWGIPLVCNNLGNASRELADYAAAKAHYTASLEGYRTFEDAWGLAFLFEDMAVFAAATGEATMAFELLGAAETQHDAIGSPRNPAQEQELAEKFSSSRRAIGERGAEEATARGRLRNTEQAIAAGLDFLSG